MVYRPNVDQQLCFVLMPFQPLHFEYFEGIIAPAAKEVGLKAIKADDIYGTAPIIRDIWQSIWKATVVIADVSGKNPNVNYELGLSHALGVPTILITQDLADVPFDYRHRRCIPYDTRRLNWQDKLRKDISLTIKAVLDGEVSAEDLSWPYDTGLLRAMTYGGSFVPAETAREFLARGIIQTRDAISMAFGIHGTTISVSTPYGADKSQRSGYAIAAAQTSSDPIIQLGLDQVRGVAHEADAELGDGTKTAALLFCEMVLQGFKALKSGALLRDLVDQMDIATEVAVQYLARSARSVGPDDAIDVAVTAAVGDATSGEIAEEAVRRAGKDGIVLIEDSANLSTDLIVRTGMYFDRGFVDGRFITDEANQVAILDRAYVLLCGERIGSMWQLLPILERIVHESGQSSVKSLLVITEDIESNALETLILNNSRKSFLSVAVKSPGFNMRRDILEDIAIATGGVVQPTALLDATTLSQLGYATRVEVSKDSTWLIEPKGNPDLIASRAAGIRQQISVTRSDHESEKLRERLAKLTGATAVIRVGGASFIDRDERRYRIDAALHAIRSAFISGAIPGGGSTLWRAHSAVMQKPLGQGGQVISEALMAPLKVHLKNSGTAPENLLEHWDAHQSNGQTGFNALKLCISDLVEDGVLDSTGITVRSLQIAFSHARKVLQTGAWDISSHQSKTAS